LRKVLKVLLRSLRFKCINASELPPEATTTTTPEGNQP
jgi:hypothetical protein